MVPAEVLAIWQKGVRTAVDAMLPALNPDTVVNLAYQAQMQAALALLQARGLRTHTQAGHHAKVIKVLRSYAKQEEHPRFVEALDQFDALRQARATSVYNADPATEGDAEWARTTMRAMLPEALRALQTLLPSLGATLPVFASTPAPRVKPEIPSSGTQHATPSQPVKGEGT